MTWVVRAGKASAVSLIDGYDEHVRVPGLFGFSVQYAPGKSVEELAISGRFPHAQISYAEEALLAGALAPLGYTMRLVSSPGTGYHHTFAVLYDGNGMLLQELPPDAATVISKTFRRRPNPYLQAP